MKLRNKKTGEIKEWSFAMLQNVMQTTEKRHYNSLTELNEEWEDYQEEPKDFWFIDNECGVIYDSTDENLWDKKYDIKFMKVIGNYFNTFDEAEQAVEKLKAWKRLKDKGFRFFNNKIIGEYGNVSYRLTYPVTTVEEKDLDLLFGGEEQL